MRRPALVDVALVAAVAAMVFASGVFVAVAVVSRPSTPHTGVPLTPEPCDGAQVLAEGRDGALTYVQCVDPKELGQPPLHWRRPQCDTDEVPAKGRRDGVPYVGCVKS